MADYPVAAFFEYSVVGTTWTLAPTQPTLIPGAVFPDADTTFDLGEDLSTDASGFLYQGFITIDGVDYPVVSGAAGDTSILRVLIPEGTDPATVTAPVTVDTSLPGSPFQAASFAHCFAAGTLIATPKGEVPVETLQPGQTVLTADGRPVTVAFLGWQDIDRRFPTASSPSIIRIEAGALGDGLPRRDLTVTGGHAMMLDGLLVTAAALVNGCTIRALPRAETDPVVRVYHIETASHEVLLAEGAPSESFIDYVGRKGFANYGDYLALFGADRLIREMAVPRITVARMLPRQVRARLDAAAGIDGSVTLARAG